jgi:signal transduction histidine kinase/sugar lactone lactonase YvrE
VTRRVRALLVAASAICILWQTRVGAVDLRDVLTGYTYTSWSRKDGLAGPVWAITQDGNGFLWLGTDSGLVRFDGVRFFTWEALGGQPLPRLPIRALLVAPGGTLWVGFGGSGGVARIDNRTVTTYVNPQVAETMGAVTAVQLDATGALWASAASGLFRLDNDQWTRLGPKDGLPDDGPASAYIDRSGALWVSTPEGLFRRPQASSGAFTQIEPSSDPQRTLSFSEDTEGRVWATDPVVGFRPLAARVSLGGADAGRGYRLLHDRDGNLWVATIGQGLWRAKAPVDPGAKLVIERATVLSGLSSDAVRTVFEDRDGNIWAGTTEGVDRLVPHRVTPWTGLGLVNTIDATADGRIWAGTADVLIPFAQVAGNWTPEEARVAIRGAVAVRGGAGGALWVATSTALFKVVGSASLPIALPRTLHSMNIEALASDQHGDAWVVTTGGDVLQTEGTQLKVVDRVPELRGVRTNAALVDHRGQLWVAYAGPRIGVVAAPGDFRTFGTAGLGTGPHYDLHEDSKGRLWVGGADGLSRLTGDHFVSAGRSNGLPPGGAYSITQDDRNDLWLATSVGIIRLAPDEFDRAVASPLYLMRFRVYDTSDGLAGYPVLLGDRNAVRAADGTLWFVTSRGISVADPRRLSTLRLAPLVAIDQVRADDRPLYGSELKPGTSKLEIEYTAPDLTSPLKTRFRYRLEGFDSDWIDAGTRREALYTNLAPGEYHFRVTASQDDGRWSETEATWAFTMAPQFYQTWWFYAVVAASVVAITWGAWQFRVRQLRRQFALVLGERVRLSRELHDTLLQSLVGVALEFDAISKSLDASPSHARERVIKIREQVEEYIREARRSIWSLRSPSLDTGDLIDALRDSAARAIPGHGATFRFEQTGERRRLPSNVEHQLLRIGQEALLNAARHSEAATITMRLAYEPDDVSLTIVDDGRGFDAVRAAETTTDHYGLTTMRERAQQAGGRLSVSSSPGRGTTITAIVPATADMHQASEIAS